MWLNVVYDGTAILNTRDQQISQFLATSTLGVEIEKNLEGRWIWIQTPCSYQKVASNWLELHIKLRKKTRLCKTRQAVINASKEGNDKSRRICDLLSVQYNSRPYLLKKSVPLSKYSVARTLSQPRLCHICSVLEKFHQAFQYIQNTTHVYKHTYKHTNLHTHKHMKIEDTCIIIDLRHCIPQRRLRTFSQQL